ncbi:MAG TPA: glycosyltransferase [Candidatus Paceibacterota bacterium]|nr:glycosyltransferase [Candidatus Paceibacterota bacterium]
MKDRICAILTAYNSSTEIGHSLAAIIPQVTDVVVIDDHSDPEHFAALKKVMASFPSATIIRHPENYGLGNALNHGLRYAQEHGYPWAMTLDDNSIAEPDMVAKMMAAYSALPIGRQDKIAVLAPNYTTLKGPVYHAPEPLPITTTITAGELVKTAIWQQLGGFNETLIIGGIDHDFSFRVIKAGYQTLLIPSAMLHETPGLIPMVHSLFGKSFIVPSYGPWRYYYTYRNNIFLYKKYWRVVPGWIAKNIFSDALNFAKIMIFEENRWQKMRMVSRGVRDGSRGRSGKIAA